ncbi:hypothetical protein CTAYLR_003351 [Chrysophaeum taylorii]|uniref:Glutaredoxin-like protein n=1 Tax=Chrysophaeum taylorii TaxID=2483200 RepID=A0AAD7UEK4_9STRA|nr:hypothetical protein CTAYLR_003351 [Chrysophaeum taylorii]
MWLFLFAASRVVVPRARQFASVSGLAWEDGGPRISLYTKEGCTLCDDAKDVLAACRSDIPHSLELVDITDEDNESWWGRYKYDIPVLHIDGVYWAKHRITRDQARAALIRATDARIAGLAFAPTAGEPDAARLEREQRSGRTDDDGS